MACPEVQTLGLYPPASQRSAQQSLLLNTARAATEPASPALLMPLPLATADKGRQIRGRGAAGVPAQHLPASRGLGPESTR